MAATGSRLSFRGTPPGPGFEVRLVRIEPGERRPYRPDEWADALVVVEAGTIELETAEGRIRFGDGAVLHLTALSLTSVRNTDAQPAILSAVTRRPRNQKGELARIGRATEHRSPIRPRG